MDRANEYIATEAPWKLAKDGAPGSSDALDAVLWNATEAVRLAAVMLSPVMPAACDEIRRRIGESVESPPRWAADGQWRTSGDRVVVSGPALWPRLEPKETVVSEQIPAGPAEPAIPKGTASPAVSQADGSAEPASAAAPAVPEAPAQAASQWPVESRISIEDFMRIDLRVAKVLTAEKVPNSKKLVKLTIDLGSEQRTLVAGIAEAYEADALIGRTVAIVANLKPAKLMGIESNGMILAASPDGGRPMLVAFDQPPAPGTRIR